MGGLIHIFVSICMHQICPFIFYFFLVIQNHRGTGSKIMKFPKVETHFPLLIPIIQSLAEIIITMYQLS